MDIGAYFIYSKFFRKCNTHLVLKIPAYTATLYTLVDNAERYYVSVATVGITAK